jgi:hypothetical protein
MASASKSEASHRRSPDGLLALLAALSGLYLVGVTPWRYEARRLVKRK